MFKIVKPIFNLLAFLLFTSALGQSTSEFDSLQTLATASKEDTTKVKLLNNAAWLCAEMGDFDKAKVTANKAIAIANKANYFVGESEALNNLGNIFWTEGDIDKALEQYIKAFKIAIATKNLQKVSKYVGNVGLISMSKGNYAKALDYYFISLKIEEFIKNKKAIAKNLGTIGTIYKEQKDYKQALNYLLKSIVISEQINNKSSMATTYGNLGNVYSELNQYEQALLYYKKALALETELGDKYGLSGELSNVGVLYMSMAEDEPNKKRKDSLFSVAMPYFKQSLTIAKQYGIKNVEAFNFHSLASAYMAQKQIKLARLYADSAISLQKEMQALYYLGTSYLIKSRADSALGMFESAYTNYKLYHLVLDSLNKDENQKGAVQKHMQYEFEKKENAQKILQEKKDAILTEEKKRERIILYFVIFFSVIVIASGLFIYRSLKITQRQKKLVEKQKDQLNKQKIIVEEKNKEITQSIEYAQKIQSAILPSLQSIKNIFPNSFILYKPKDIVAGDFYWMEQVNDLVFIAAADCTGHGVPGAMVSVICSGALNRSVKEFNLTEPGQILDKTRSLVLETFAKSNSDVKDGMDISLAYVNLKSRELLWSGANNPLWYISNNQFYEISAHKQSIGKTDAPVNFPTHKIILNQNDSLFLFTDGLPDQFGGPKGKKFKYKPFQELLLQNSTLSMNDLGIIVEKTISEWKGEFEQVDDILVIGIKL